MEIFTDSQDYPLDRLDPLSFLSNIYSQDVSLRDLAKSNNLHSLHNRFISWRVFLNIFPENSPPSIWIEKAQAHRKRYQELKSSFDSVKIPNLDPQVFNPLSQSTENPWNSFYQDNELKQTIRKDLDRTLQERALFQKEETKEILLQVLFVWCKENPDIGYRQGMNELLAIFFIVGYTEKADFEFNLTNKIAENILKELNDPQYLEADIFELFSRLMRLGVKELFLPVVSKRSKMVNNLLNFEKSSIENEFINNDKTNDVHTSKILKRCHRVHHRLLQALDKQLYNYIESQKIEPQIYLQRWIRCMLTREFNLSNTLILWDCIFAYVHVQQENKIESFTGKLDFTQELVMIDFICVAMIVFVRGSLLQCDSIGIMRRLLKYPPVEDLSSIISMAQGYQERVLSGKGVTVPQAMAEDENVREKGEFKHQAVLIKSDKGKIKISDRVNEIVDVLKDQVEGGCKDLEKMRLVLEQLNILKIEISKLPKKVR